MILPAFSAVSVIGELEVFDDRPFLERMDHLREGLPAGTIVTLDQPPAAYGTRTVNVRRGDDFQIKVSVPMTDDHIGWQSIRNHRPDRLKGIWKTFAGNLAAVAYAAGRPSIHYEAGYEDGGYAAARGRFKLAQCEWEYMRRKIGNRLDGYAPFIEAHVKGGAEAVSDVRRLLKSDDARSIWTIADNSLDCTASFSAMGQKRMPDAFYASFSYGDLEIGTAAEMPRLLEEMLRASGRPQLGWMLLAHTNYDTEWPLCDPETQAHLVNAYPHFRDMVYRLM